MSTISETFSLFDGIKPTAVIALIGVRIYPNTPLRQRAVEEGVIKESSTLFKPEFYLTPAEDASSIVKRVAEHAAAQFNWVVPSLDINYNAYTFSLSEKKGGKGALMGFAVMNRNCFNKRIFGSLMVNWHRERNNAK